MRDEEQERIGGIAAYRWSVRLRRPLLHAGSIFRPTRYPGRITLLYAQPRRVGPFGLWRCRREVPGP